MTTNTEAGAIFFAIILIACAVGVVYGVYLAITTPNKVEGALLAIVSAVVAAFLL